MKYLKKIFESNEDDKKYIEEFFLEISENPNFEVDDLIEVNLTEESKNMSVYKIHIEPGESISLPQSADSTSSQLSWGKIQTSLDFLIKKNEIISELYKDIDVSLKRFKDQFPISDYQIYANRIDEIDIVLVLKK